MQDDLRISLRKANFSDKEFLWRLRNQPDVYKYSRQNRPVCWKEHTKWIESIILGITKKDLFIIQQKSIPIGQIRFDYQKNNKTEVGIAISKEFRGKGVGVKSFKKAIGLLKKQKKIKTIMAEVHKNNVSSQKLFEKLNFKLKRKNGNWLIYILNL